MESPPIHPLIESSAPSRLRWNLSRIAKWVVVAQIVLVSLVAGWRAREHVWYQTEPIRFRGDVRNAFQHGWNIIELARQQQSLGPELLPSWPATFRAYLDYYDHVRAGRASSNYNLDYPPMRLLVMATWTRWAIRDGYRFDASDLRACWPLLWFNAAVALLGAVGAFLLVRHWLLRACPTNPDRALWCGLSAGILLWLNLAVLVDGYAWPQWDVWIVPFYLFSMLAASQGRWLVAGVIFSTGIMFKGQLLAVAPVLLLWPLAGGQWRGALRLLVGLLAGLAIIQSMWVFSKPSSATIAALFFLALGGLRWWYPRFLKGKHVLLIAAGSVGIFIAALLTRHNFAWATQGFIYGAEKRSNLLAGKGANNLGAILRDSYRWESTDEIVTTIAWLDWSMTLRHFMVALYGIGAIACVVALAIHSRRNDVRALAAMTAPWVIFHALMPQMSSRYLVWGAATTAVLTAIGFGPVLIHLLISICAAAGIVHMLIGSSQAWNWWPALTQLLNGSHPGSGWLTLMLAGVMLYLACSRTPQRQ